MDAFFNRFKNMSTTDPRCIDVTVLYKDIEYFAETRLIRFTPRRLSDYELDFIVNDLEKNCNIQLSENFIQVYLSQRSEPEILDTDIADNANSQDTSEDDTDANPTHFTSLFPEEYSTDEERDYNSDVTD